jgi:hypothetical protein
MMTRLHSVRQESGPRRYQRIKVISHERVAGSSVACSQWWFHSIPIRADELS